MTCFLKWEYAERYQFYDNFFPLHRRNSANHKLMSSSFFFAVHNIFSHRHHFTEHLSFWVAIERALNVPLLYALKALSLSLVRWHKNIYWKWHFRNEFNMMKKKWERYDNSETIYVHHICMCVRHCGVENKSLAIDWYIKWFFPLSISLAAAAVWYNQQYQFYSAALCVSICFMCYVWWSSAMLKWFIDWLLVDQNCFFFYVISIMLFNQWNNSVSLFVFFTKWCRFYFAKMI